MRKLLFIYLITNKVNNKQYITSSFTQPDYYKKYFFSKENRKSFPNDLLNDFIEHKNIKGYNTGFKVEFLDARFINDDSDKINILNYFIKEHKPYYNARESSPINSPVNKLKDYNFRYNLYRKMKILRKIINGNYKAYIHSKPYKEYIDEFLNTGTIKFYEDNIEILKQFNT